MGKRTKHGAHAHHARALPPRAAQVTPTPSLKVTHNDVPELLWPSELALLPARLPSRIKVLTLDCFDTILWRDVAQPIDVFFDLAQSPVMRRHGLTAGMRIKAEAKARSHRRLRDGSVEVSLRDIYTTALPHAGGEEIDALIAAEIEAEARACKAYPATVALIRAAHARGLAIHVVSDTYLESSQLRALLQRCLPADAADLITQVFCSCETGVSKARGMFTRVLPKLGVAPATVAHLGDHPVADFTAARAAGVSGIRLRQHDAQMDELHRLTAVAGGVALPSLRNTQAFPMPYRGAFGALSGVPRDAATTLGALTIGPVMHAFAHYLHREWTTLCQHHPSVKMAFLMRDGHLPERAFAAWHEAQGLTPPAAPRLAISRFIAFGASLRNQADVDAYLAAFIGSRRFADFARQLLLPDDVASDIVKAAQAASNPEAEFVRLVHRPQTLDCIFRASTALRARLIRYLEQAAGLKRGDTLVFVDLGYEGTAQRLLAPVLRDEMDVKLIARYLIASPTVGWEQQRAGLIDASWCDERAMMALVRYIALLEDLCTAGGASVIDYTEDGEPVMGQKTTPAAQVDAIAPVQQAAIDFVRKACVHFKTTGEVLDTPALARHCLATLTRLLHAPTSGEINYLAGFQLDMGLGTDIDLKLFDLDAGQRALRERGLIYMEENLSGMRMNTPHELRASGLELALTHLAQNRFALDLHAEDLRLQHESIPVIVLRGEAHTRSNQFAHATHEGWFALHVPAGTGDMTIALALGEVYRSVQIDSVRRLALAQLHAQSGEQSEDASHQVELDGINLQYGGVALCEHKNALLVIHPLPQAATKPFLYRIVLRPLARRDNTLSA